MQELNFFEHRCQLVEHMIRVDEDWELKVLQLSTRRDLARQTVLQTLNLIIAAECVDDVLVFVCPVNDVEL